MSTPGRSPLQMYTIGVIVFGLISIPAALYMRFWPGAMDYIIPPFNKEAAEALLRQGMDSAASDDRCGLGPSYALRSMRVVTPEGIHPAQLIIQNGRIQEVLEWDAETTMQIQDVGNLIIMPGLIDPHVHVNEPGRTSWEGYASATKAAAAGGTTMMLDMPLNCVPSTVSAEALEQKITAIRKANLKCDVGIIGGAVPGFLDQIPELARSGVFAFKSFMIDSQSADFPHVESDHLRTAMETISKLPGQPYTYILHAEKDNPAEDPKDEELEKLSDRDHAKHLRSRPEVWETRAVAEALEVASDTGCKIHIAHVGSAKAASLIAEARRSSGADVTAEVCTHNLLFAAEKVPEGNTLYKCAPPIRTEETRQLLWEALLHGESIDLIASDHSPAPPELKCLADGNFMKAWGGIAGLQYRLQGAWTAAKDKKVPVETLSKLLSTNVADIFGMSASKGRIARGLDADLVIWDPDAKQEIKEEDCQHQHKTSAFTGWTLNGVVRIPAGPKTNPEIYAEIEEAHHPVPSVHTEYWFYSRSGSFFIAWHPIAGS